MKHENGTDCQLHCIGKQQVSSRTERKMIQGPQKSWQDTEVAHEPAGVTPLTRSYRADAGVPLLLWPLAHEWVSPHSVQSVTRGECASALGLSAKKGRYSVPPLISRGGVNPIGGGKMFRIFQCQIRPPLLDFK